MPAWTISLCGWPPGTSRVSSSAFSRKSHLRSAPRQEPKRPQGHHGRRMLTGIDHIVIVVQNLDEAARNYEKLGFTVVPGGRHPVGSHNVLISFADGSYIEIISFYQPSPDHRWWK